MVVLKIDRVGNRDGTQVVDRLIIVQFRGSGFHPIIKIISEYGLAGHAEFGLFYLNDRPSVPFAAVENFKLEIHNAPFGGSYTALRRI